MKACVFVENRCLFVCIFCIVFCFFLYLCCIVFVSLGILRIIVMCC